MRPLGRSLAVALAAMLVVAPASASATEAPRATLTLAASAGRTALAPSAIAPRIVWRKIPFGVRRKRQMAAYSQRHYGERTWRLTDPKVIVEHYTDGTSFDPAWNHFASNAAHLGEKPGVCAHFVVDTDGTVYQLVNLSIRCRHAIGMNWTAIGIEHVGTRARDILDDRRMMRASLRLTAWLMVRYGIDIGNVIGHAETLESPYHHERYRAWRCSTHADWNHAEMRIYRRRLARVARRLDVPVGAGPSWIRDRC